MRRFGARGAAVVDFVLILLLLVPLFLGIVQVSLVLYVRNALASAAAEGARAGAGSGADLGTAVVRTREEVRGVLAGHYTEDVRVARVILDGVPTVEVTVHARVPALGVAGPAVDLTIQGHAVQEPG